MALSNEFEWTVCECAVCRADIPSSLGKICSCCRDRSSHRHPSCNPRCCWEEQNDMKQQLHNSARERSGAEGSLTFHRRRTYLQRSLRYHNHLVWRRCTRRRKFRMCSPSINIRRSRLNLYPRSSRHHPSHNRRCCCYHRNFRPLSNFLSYTHP